MSNISDEAIEYLNRCARIRHISRLRLLERLMQTICQDQLVLSILDDESKQPRWLPGETSNSEYHSRRGSAGARSS